jgi:hypothetical protein
MALSYYPTILLRTGEVFLVSPSLGFWQRSQVPDITKPCFSLFEKDEGASFSQQPPLLL